MTLTQDTTRRRCLGSRWIEGRELIDYEIAEKARRDARAKAASVQCHECGGPSWTGTDLCLQCAHNTGD